MPGTIPGGEDRATGKTDKMPTLLELRGGTEGKQSGETMQRGGWCVHVGVSIFMGGQGLSEKP